MAETLKEVKVENISVVETPYGIKILIEGVLGEKFYIRPHNFVSAFKERKLILSKQTSTNKEGKVLSYYVLLGVE